MRSALDFGAPETDAGGNVAAKICAHVTPATERCSNCRNQVHEPGVLLKFTQRRDVDPAGRRHPAEVVAGHVDDHDVLAPVLLRDVRRSAPGALDRAGRDDVCTIDVGCGTRTVRDSPSRPEGRPRAGKPAPGSATDARAASDRRKPAEVRGVGAGGQHAAQVDLVDRALLDQVADGLDAARCSPPGQVTSSTRSDADPTTSLAGVRLRGHRRTARR